MINLPIGMGLYESEIPTLASLTCTNWIPIVPKSGAVNDRALLDRSGIASFGISTGKHRGAIQFGGVYISIDGQNLNSVDSSGVSTVLGTIEGLGRCSLAKSEEFLVIVNNVGDGFVYDPTGPTVTKITDGNYVAASTVAFVDGYFVFTQLDGKQFFSSDLGDPLSYTSTFFSSAEERPDPIVAAFVYNNLLHILGTETIEKYNNQGGIQFPFVRINQATNQNGCLAFLSPLKVSDSFTYIGGGENEAAQIFLFSGNSPSLISTPAIDNTIQNFTKEEISNAFSMTWQERGQHIIAYTFESTVIDSITLAFNLKSGQWFELSSDLKEFRARSVVKVFGEFLVGDNDNNIGVFDDSIHTDYGSNIHRETTIQPILANNGDEFQIGELEAWFESGTGLLSDPNYRTNWDLDMMNNARRDFETIQDATFTINNQGSRIFVVDDSANLIRQYNLDVPKDLGSLSDPSKTLDVSSKTTSPVSCSVSETGDLIIVLDSSGFIHTWDLATPFDLSTASFLLSSTSGGSGDVSVMFYSRVKFNFIVNWDVVLMITISDTTVYFSQLVITGVGIGELEEFFDGFVAGTGLNGVFVQPINNNFYISSSTTQDIKKYSITSLPSAFHGSVPVPETLVDTGESWSTEFYDATSFMFSYDGDKLYVLHKKGDTGNVDTIEQYNGFGQLNPQVTLEVSEDLGRTFGNQLDRHIGKKGKYKDRSVWRKQGWSSRDRVYRLSASDRARFNLMKLTAS